MKTEKCVMCGKETAIEERTPINLRPYYVEGAGQCCRECYNKIYGKEAIHDVCTEPETKKSNIVKEAILGVYVFGVALFLCGVIDNLSEPHFWLYLGAFAAMHFWATLFLEIQISILITKRNGKFYYREKISHSEFG